MTFRVFRFYFIIIFCLSTIQFYSPVFIPFSVLSLINYVFFLATVSFIIVSNTDTKEKIYTNPFFLLTIAILISGFSAWYSWGQGLLDSFKPLTYYLSYNLFFLLLIWKTRVKDIEQIILLLGVIYIIVFSVTFLFHPIQIFGGIQDFADDRGFQRITLPGTGFLFLFSFYSLKQYLKERRLLWLIIFIISDIFIVMLLSRTLMFVSFIIFTLFILRLSSIFKKIIALLFIGCFAFLISQMEFFQLLTEQTKEQRENVEEDIRVLSATFYLNEFSPNTFSRIFGNGEGTIESSYGQNIDYLKNELGYYQSDIGYIGLYSKFGILAILAYLFLIYKTIKIPIPDDYLYFKYYLYFIFIISTIIDASFSTGYITSIALSAYVLYSKDLKRINNRRELQSDFLTLVNA